MKHNYQMATFQEWRDDLDFPSKDGKELHIRYRRYANYIRGINDAA